jgi:hypothetical protein
MTIATGATTRTPIRTASGTADTATMITIAAQTTAPRLPDSARQVNADAVASIKKGRFTNRFERGVNHAYNTMARRLTTKALSPGAAVNTP